MGIPDMPTCSECGCEGGKMEFTGMRWVHSRGSACIRALKLRLKAEGWHNADEDPPEYDWYVTETDAAHEKVNGHCPYIMQFYDGSWLRPIDRWKPVNTDRP